jgi:hypothetical protein
LSFKAPLGQAIGSLLGGVNGLDFSIAGPLLVVIAEKWDAAAAGKT